MTIKKAPNANPAIKASNINTPLIAVRLPGVQETKNIASSAINTPKVCCVESFSPESKPQMTGRVAHATAVIGATIAIGPFAKPLYRRVSPHKPKPDARTPRKKSSVLNSSAINGAKTRIIINPRKCEIASTETTFVFFVALPPKKSPVPASTAAANAKKVTI